MDLIDASIAMKDSVQVKQIFKTPQLSLFGLEFAWEFKDKFKEHFSERN